MAKDEQPPPHPHSPAAWLLFFAAFIQLLIALLFSFFSLQESLGLTGAGLQQQQDKGGREQCFRDIPIPRQAQGRTDLGLKQQERGAGVTGVFLI